MNEYEKGNIGGMILTGREKISMLLGGRHISIQCCQHLILHYTTLRLSLGSGIAATNRLSSGTVN